MRDRLLIICGPTATGKTKIAVDLARQFDGELVSADSRQVYRGMDIATGKDFEDIAGVPMWMIDVVDPDEEFSVSHYASQAYAVIEDIRKRGKLPIVVGGTGFYINALISGIDTLDIPPDQRLREKLSVLQLGELQKRLQLLDKDVFDGMNESDRQNPRRLIRKIEIFTSGNKKKNTIAHDVDVLRIGLTAPMEEIYRRIDARVEKRMAQGIKDEIQMLLKKGYSWEMPSMNTLGYKQWKDAPSDEDALKRWKFAEHAYARRQMTWFRKMPNIQWVDVMDQNFSAKVTKNVTQWYTEHTHS